MSERRQILIFIEFLPPEGRPCNPAKPVRVDFGERDIKNVWTLYRNTDKSNPPALPYVPVHRQNAFLEDWMHDWNIDSKGRFRYASRITDEPVWVLVELK